MSTKSSERTGAPARTGGSPGGTGTQVAELKDLVVGYAKQETVDPLKTLGRYLGFGIAGSVFIGTGVCLLLLALLRGLQKIDIFNEPGKVSGGTFSWAPYLITAAAGLVLAGLFVGKLIALLKQRENQ